MSAAQERVTEYLRQRKRMMRDLGQDIHVVHSDPAADMVALSVADLEEVLALSFQGPHKPVPEINHGGYGYICAACKRPVRYSERSGRWAHMGRA